MTEKENLNAISTEEKNLFAQTESVEDDVQVASVQEDDFVAKAEVVAEEPTPVMSDDDDVRVIGYGDIDLFEGRSVIVEELGINGQHVAVIDVDKDGVGDYAMSDLNQNPHADENDVIDLQTGVAISFSNDQTAMDDAVADVDLNMIPA